jgi:hypothetical protein
MLKTLLLTIFLSTIIILTGCSSSNDSKNESKKEVKTEEDCKKEDGIWRIWDDIPNAKPRCNLPTSDEGKECTDSSQCQSHCEAPENTDSDINVMGHCYGYKFAICSNDVINGKATGKACY